MATWRGLIWSILKALYCVLFVVLIAEKFTGQEFLESSSRYIMSFATAVIAFQWLSISLAPPGQTNDRRRMPPTRIVDKRSTDDATRHLQWASSEVQGWRDAMEDAVCINVQLQPPLSQKALFAVFDGHGGDRVSKITAQMFPQVIAECAAEVYRELEANGDKAPPADKDREEADKKVLHKALRSMDAMLRKAVPCRCRPKAAVLPGQKCLFCGKEFQRATREAVSGISPFEYVGSTAIVVLVDCGEETPHRGRPRRITVANCGDSRAVLCRDGRALQLSEDHKPELPGEKDRIEKAGGTVQRIHHGACFRLDGNGLNLSRALGDFHYKANYALPIEEQKVIAVPEIETLTLNEHDEFMVLACDGVFELHTSQDVVDIVRCELGREGGTPRKAAEILVEKSVSPDLRLTQFRGGDNCSTIVLRLNSGGCRPI